MMTFNIRGSFIASDGVNTWDKRYALNISTIKHYAPDLIGFQEVQEGNLKIYQKQLTEYNRVKGFKYNNKPPYCYLSIFWNSSRFKLIDSGSFWLSKTPNRYSSDWGTAYIRSAVWVKLQNINTGLNFLCFNTHLDNISKLARKEGAKVIIQKMDEVQSDNIPVILTGDFNCNYNSNVYQFFIENGFTDTYIAAGNIDSKESYTFHAFTGKQQPIYKRIDWILFKDGLNRIHVKSCFITRDNQHPLYPSDHFPVIADF